MFAVFSGCSSNDFALFRVEMKPQFPVLVKSQIRTILAILKAIRLFLTEDKFYVCMYETNVFSNSLPKVKDIID